MKELSEVLREGGLEKLRRLVEQNQLNLRDRDELNRTLLHWICWWNLPEIAEYLILKGLEVNAEDSYGKTPLHRAVAHSSLRAIEVLLKAGAKTKIKDNFGLTPITLAEKLTSLCPHSKTYKEILSKLREN